MLQNETSFIRERCSLLTLCLHLFKPNFCERTEFISKKLLFDSSTPTAAQKLGWRTKRARKDCQMVKNSVQQLCLFGARFPQDWGRSHCSKFIPWIFSDCHFVARADQAWAEPNFWFYKINFSESWSHIIQNDFAENKVRKNEWNLAEREQNHAHFC